MMWRVLVLALGLLCFCVWGSVRGDDVDLTDSDESELLPDEEENASSTGDEGNPIVSSIALLLTSLAIFALGFMLKRWYSKSRHALTDNTQPSRKPQTEAEFERQMMMQMGIRPGDLAELERSSRGTPATVSSETQPRENAGRGVPAPIEPLPAIRAIIERLRAARLVDETESVVPAGVELPGGWFVTMRSRKRIALVSCTISLDRIFAHIRTIDYVILVREDGSALTCRALSEFLADSILPN